MASDNKRLDAALWYARRGWAVLPLHTPSKSGRCSCGQRPCASSGKHPRTLHGVKDATTDRATIRDWWREWPRANVGIATGSASGILVLDIDPRNHGEDTLATYLEQHGPLPDVPTVDTGGGGAHFFFKFPEGLGSVKLGPGIDVQGEGKYIVAPPSFHPSGRYYKWRRAMEPKETLPLPPEWMRKSVKRASKGNGIPGNGDGPIPDGQRNVTLASIAGAMRRQGADEDTIFVALMHTNRTRCLPPLPEEDVRTIAGSVSKYVPEPDYLQPPEYSDLGNAERLVQRHGEDLHYTNAHGWLIWDSTRWTRDPDGEVERRAKDAVRAIPEEIALLPDDADDERKRIMKHYLASQSNGKLTSMIALAASEPGIAIRTEAFDQDNWKLTVENGMIDLRTGKLLPHDRQILSTKKAPVVYDPDATAPRFEAFIDEIMLGHPGLIRWLQSFLGYCLTGDVSESILPIWYGQGQNGKSTLLTVLGKVLGPDYSGAAPPGLMMQRRGESHPTELADLSGKRLIIAAETGEGKALAVDLVKQLTGGDKIKGRYMRQDFFEFDPTHKIVLMTNHKPVIRNTEFATWRRIKLVPFEYTVPDKRKDKHLEDKLIAEAPGILNWLIAGCLAWQKKGLIEPPEILAATNSYRQESDLLADFIEDCCYFADDASVSVDRLYNTYLAWNSKTGGMKPMSKSGLTRRLEPRPEVNRVKIHNVRSWAGIGLKFNDIEIGEDDDDD